jgi:hypothetical protein
MSSLIALNSGRGVGDDLVAADNRGQQLILEVHDQEFAVFAGQSLGRTHRNHPP